MRWYAIPAAGCLWLAASGEPVMLALGGVLAACAGALWLADRIRGR